MGKDSAINNLKDYKEKKNKIIKQISDIRDKLPDEELQKIINEKIETLSKDRFIISVFGHYSNGKSTFLNALMGFGDEILVEDELASTAAITRLKYPEDIEMLNLAEVKFSNGEKKVISINEIKNYSARNNNFDVENKIVEVILYLDSEILKNGVEIVDTPGFNSTYQIHTEIAEKHVNKSDASIFLFSYDQPGSLAEFEFLRKISNKMDRVFLVINKIDKEDLSEGTVDDVICDIKKKINKTGVNVDNKIIYKISALMEREGIKNDSEEIRRASLFNEFKDILITYLTSEENIKDRIGAPLKNIASNIEQYKLISKKSLECYTTEGNKIKDEIDKKLSELEIIKSELKDKRNHINKMTKENISRVKRNIQNKIDSAIDNIKDELKNVNSEFAINYLDFEEMTSYYASNIERCWDELKKELENNINEIIDETIDYDSESDEIKEKIMSIINKKLEFKIEDTKEPKIDYKALDEYDKKIKEKKKDYDDAMNRYFNKKKDLMKNRSDEDERNRIRAEIKKLEYDKEKTLSDIGHGQIYRGKEQYIEYKDRDGIGGKVVQFFAGKKKVEKQRDIYDDTEVIMKNKYREEEEDKYDNLILCKEKRLKEIIQKLNENVILDEEINEFNRDVEEKRNKYFNGNDEIERMELKSQLIDISKNKYIKQIRHEGEEFEEKLINNLNSNEKLIIKIIEEALVFDKHRIENLEEEMYTLKTKENMTPEEVDLKIKEISEKIVILNESEVNINKIRKGEAEV